MTNLLVEDSPASSQPTVSGTAKNAIELRGIRKSYGDEVALHELDLDILDGEFFCLLGPSGCGKTTTLNIIGGFVGATAGAVSVAGVNVTKLPPNRRPINTVFQSYALFPHLSVIENVAFGMRMAKVPKPERLKRAQEALDLVGLGTFSDRAVTKLSGGQAQRVAVARALVNKPKVLLLDEPLGALDLKLRKRLQTELSIIQRQVGTTFVFVTHDQEEAMGLADRIAILNGGRIEQIGTPEEIYRRPCSRYVAEFIGESNILGGRKQGEVFHLENGAHVPITANAPEDTTSLVIRPESLRITANGFLDAEIVSRAYLGATTRIVMRLSGSEQLVVSSLSDHALEDHDRTGLEIGQMVSLAWSIKAAHPLVEQLEKKEDPNGKSE
ncbi:ABC transporter ATP-binding protein [Arthrobacter oryzae]|uniref:Spermidine/putrescine ABC transporter ATP-binding subunit n=1 Tax=Arthrobacter oryzae TaxID=409290 RepID=A0A495EA44_9MICC|nr:ABC transporter ATP-binding protein [Arthrobacter oryzae]RKR13792.1 spermidine/putrescine ABC transporter ATP-binding subunit [Arthrobacter oryzae]